MKKRIISAALATLMAASALSTSAFAAGLKTDATLEAAGTVSIPTIDVTVPTSASFVMNPYKMEIVQYAAGAWGDSKPNSDIKKSTTLIPFYGPKADNSAEETGWYLVNNGTTNAVTVSMYATYKAGKTVEVNVASANRDATKKQVTLTLKAGSDDVTLLTAAPTAWSGDGSTGVKTFDLTANNEAGTVDNAKKAITLTGEAIAGTVAWTESDTVSISMAFKFDTKANS